METRKLRRRAWPEERGDQVKALERDIEVSVPAAGRTRQVIEAAELGVLKQ